MIDLLLFILLNFIFLLSFSFFYRFVDYFTDLIVFSINGKNYEDFLQYRKKKYSKVEGGPQ